MISTFHILLIIQLAANTNDETREYIHSELKTKPPTKITKTTVRLFAIVH